MKSFSFTSIPIPSVSVDISDVINRNKDSLFSTSGAVVSTIAPTVQNALTAVGNANGKLLSELGNAGSILGGNILNLGMATGDVTSKIITRYLLFLALVLTDFSM